MTKVASIASQISEELVDLLERITTLVEKSEALDALIAVPATPAPAPKPVAKHPWRTLGPKVAQRGIGVQPEIGAAAVLPECPCVNPDKESCAEKAPNGIHTRGSGAAAQYSKCRMHEVRLAIEKPRKVGFNGPRKPLELVKPKSRTYGHLCDAGCGRETSNRYRLCKNCTLEGRSATKHSGQGSSASLIS